jgi:hypothetical protein
MQNSKATCQARARQHTRLQPVDRETRQKLDSSTATRRPGAWSVGVSLDRLDSTRQELDRLDRQGLDSGLDSAGDVGFVIEFGGVCYQDTYPMYRACILHVS